MMKEDELKPGQRFQTHEGYLWELEKFAPVKTSIPHVKLVGVRDRTACKVVAASTLVEGRQFFNVETLGQN